MNSIAVVENNSLPKGGGFQTTRYVTLQRKYLILVYYCVIYDFLGTLEPSRVQV